MRDQISVRQWQELYHSGAFEPASLETQVRAGWYDWFCRDNALTGRLKKIGSVVMGIREPAILDHYYVWFKNNCPLDGSLYDDVRFEPLEGKRRGKYFVVSLDCPYEEQKWTLYTERHGFEEPEFACGNVREMMRYINDHGKELAKGTQPPAVAKTICEIAEILKKHDVCGDMDALQGAYRKGLGQRMLSGIRDENGKREVLSTSGGEYVIVDCCNDSQKLKTIQHRIQAQMNGLDVSAGKVRGRVRLLERFVGWVRKERSDEAA